MGVFCIISEVECFLLHAVLQEEKLSVILFKRKIFLYIFLDFFSV